MTKLNDQDCIRKILEGDVQTFSVLVDRYKNMVYTVALRMLKNNEEAEEVSQDTFLKGYKSLSNFKGDSKFSTWLYRIAYNTCLDRIKKNKKEELTVTIDEYTVNKIKVFDNALDQMEIKERNKMIKECIALLPSEASLILTLYYFEELSLDEISKIVGYKANNIKVKLFRARKELMHIFKAKLEPETIASYGA